MYAVDEGIEYLLKRDNKYRNLLRLQSLSSTAHYENRLEQIEKLKELDSTIITLVYNQIEVPLKLIESRNKIVRDIDNN